MAVVAINNENNYYRRGTLADCESRFAGEADEDVYSFMSEVGDGMKLYGITREEALKQFPLLLDGVAAEWWRCFNRHIHSWDEAKSKIKQHFGHGESTDTLIEQRPDEVENVPRNHEESTGSSLSSSSPGVFLYDEDRMAWDLTKFPRRFSGAKDEYVLDFIEELGLFIEVNRIPFEFVLPQLGRLFKYPATNWWAHIQGSIKTWEELRDGLCKRFVYGGGLIISTCTLMSRLNQRRQQPHERAIDYIISISSIMRKMNSPFPDSLQMEYIIQGLRPSIKWHMIGKDKLSPLQLTSDIIQVEESL